MAPSTMLDMTAPRPACVSVIDDAMRRAGDAHRDVLLGLPEVERSEVWRVDGARDVAHWVSMRYGVSMWKAQRWVAASHALPSLPRIAEALASGVLYLDKVVELTRFATPEDEGSLVAWAQRVSATAVRERGDMLGRRSRGEIAEVDRERRVEWWYTDEGRRFAMEAELPAADGAVVARTLDRLARKIPVMPGEDDAAFASARRADALVAMCGARIAADADPDRATVVVHAQADGLVAGTHGAEIEGGPAIHPETVKRLLCGSRMQVVVETEGGDVVQLGEMTRTAPAWMLRQVRYRDRGCRFPGCGSRRFTDAHHITWWRNGGRTSLENLVLICSFHHRLVHEHGWTIERSSSGDVGWRRPDGTAYATGPPARAPDAAA